MYANGIVLMSSSATGFQEKLDKLHEYVKTGV